MLAGLCEVGRFQCSRTSVEKSVRCHSSSVGDSETRSGGFQNIQLKPYPPLSGITCLSRSFMEIMHFPKAIFEAPKGLLKVCN